MSILLRAISPPISLPLRLRTVCSNACGISSHGIGFRSTSKGVVKRSVFNGNTHLKRFISLRAFTAPVLLAAMPLDHSSQANYKDIRTKHNDFDLKVDFDTKTVRGTAEITLQAYRPVSEVWLDTRGLAIEAVSQAGEDIPYKLDEPHPVLGSRLRVQLLRQATPPEEVKINICYTTSPNSTALQFLAPSQTAGGQFPYLFTQCQAIHARSFFPCQDTPLVKSTYNAVVHVPAPLRALMSAVPQEADGGAMAGDEKGFTTWKFRQAVPIPSYLVALAVGDLQGKPIGPITTVWSEPSMVDAGVFEFGETPDFLRAGEEVAGPYEWGVYDVLLLPPSFPYGGMENPCLTFVTPTLLAGDRSQANVVAHEIAHSWFGNLVTNATWEHFWLNEGFTVFLERKILGRLYGEKTLQFSAGQGALHLEDSVRTIGSDHNFTALIPDLSGGIDPDDAFSRIPYEKGFYFIYYLQSLVGGPEVFEPFLREYVQAFKFKTVTSDDFKDFFLSHFKDVDAVKGIDWDTWFYKPGLPPVKNDYDSELAQAAYQLASRWHQADLMGMGISSKASSSFSPSDIEGWSTDQLLAFLIKLEELRAPQPFHPSTTRALDKVYGLDASKNSEIRSNWYKLCIDAGWLHTPYHCHGI
eukprot:jgi/Botrbrau1/6278/Bobra.0129s0023.1